jgi:hypothetical protein
MQSRKVLVPPSCIKLQSKQILNFNYELYKNVNL